MNKLEFAKGMKKLSTLYLKDMTEDELIVWYEMLKDVDSMVFDKAITTITKESNFFPSVASILEKCEEKNKEQKFDVIERMKADGYFKSSYELEKTYHFLEDGTIPKWLLEDMKRYSYQDQNSLTNTETRRIGVEENAII